MILNHGFNFSDKFHKQFENICFLIPECWLGLTIISAWISSNHIHYKVCDEIIYPFPNFNGVTVEVWEWINNFIPHFIMDVITHPCWDYMLIHVSKEGHCYAVVIHEILSKSYYRAKFSCAISAMLAAASFWLSKLADQCIIKSPRCGVT